MSQNYNVHKMVYNILLNSSAEQCAWLYTVQHVQNPNNAEAEGFGPPNVAAILYSLVEK